VIIAHNSKMLDLHAAIKIRTDDIDENGEAVVRIIDTTCGRVIFNQMVPAEAGYINEVLTKKSLRDISSYLLSHYITKIQPIDYQRVKYIINENERVHQVIDLLEKNDLEKVGNILLQGHHGLSKEYEVSLPELDLLVDLAQKETGVLGARLMGGGFGGATINLISNEHKSIALANIKKHYFDLTGLECKIHEVKIEDGVKRI